jgi:hypothetical protein
LIIRADYREVRALVMGQLVARNYKEDNATAGCREVLALVMREPATGDAKADCRVVLVFEMQGSTTVGDATADCREILLLEMRQPIAGQY